MTGEQLINFIKKYNLKNESIIPRDIFNGVDGDYLRFTSSNEDVDYVTLWLTNDYLQDIIYNHEGDCTGGKFSKAESDFYMASIEDRNRTIYKMYKQGYSYRDIAEEFDISDKRVSQIISKKKEHEAMISEEEPYSELYKAFIKACKYIGCNSKNATRTFNALKRNRVIGKDLSKIPDETFLEMHMIGPRAVEIIRVAWTIYIKCA